MGSHPVNLAVRLVLELAALIAMGAWGWQLTDGWLRFVLALAIPIGAAVLWGTFAVPNDPSRSGRAPIVTPGIIRLVLELAVFGFGTWALLQIGLDRLAWIMSTIVVVHYIVSYDRILWLVRH